MLVMKNFNEICENLIANGAKKITDVKIVNLKAKAYQQYTMFTIYLDRKIDGLVALEDHGICYGTATTKVDYIRTTERCLDCIMKQFNYRMEDVIGSTIDIIQQKIRPGEIYTNPFAPKPFPVEYDRLVIQNYICNIHK